MTEIRLPLLRSTYCSRCNIRAPRSTGIKLAEKYLKRGGKFLDYGCSTWRNSSYLQQVLEMDNIRVDISPESKPNVVAYPTALPFRSKSIDVVALTHVLMFLMNWEELINALKELDRISRDLGVVEMYHVKKANSLEFKNEDVLDLLTNSFSILAKVVRKDMLNVVVRVKDIIKQ